jgi:phage repressor protein C with HTH and peptisase S24 domain
MQQVEQQVEKVILPGSVRDTGGRLKQLLEYYKLTTYQANEKLGYTKSSKLYKVLNNEVRPGYDTLVELITAFPEVSPTWLLLGKGPMLQKDAVALAVETTSTSAGTTKQNTAASKDKVLTITVDREGNDNTELVPVQAQAGYGVQHNEAVYLRDLPKYRIPGFEHGNYRAFEVAGDSMEPTLNHRDIVVASYVDNWRLLEPGDVYVVVTAESVMLKRIRERIIAGDMTVMLHSDNHHRKPYPMDVADIAQLWRVRGYISTYLPSTPDVTVERLWEVIEALGFDKGEVRRHLEENPSADGPR